MICRRDPRFALDSGAPDPDAGWPGDAKTAGRAEESLDEDLRARIFDGKAARPAHLFRCDITELAVVSLPDPPEFLVIEAWTEGRGMTRQERR